MASDLRTPFQAAGAALKETGTLPALAAAWAAMAAIAVSEKRADPAPQNPSDASPLAHLPEGVRLDPIDRVCPRLPQERLTPEDNIFDADCDLPRGLTPNEAQLFSDLYGPAHQSVEVRIRFCPGYRDGDPIFLADVSPSWIGPDGSPAYDIRFYGPGTEERDYTRSEDPLLFETFAHELTHVMQFEGRLPTLPCLEDTLEARYRYTLSPDTDPLLWVPSMSGSLCSEEAAELIGNYAVKFLHPNPAVSARFDTYRIEGHYGMPTEEQFALLRDVVENNLSPAREARRALSARRFFGPAF